MTVVKFENVGLRYSTGPEVLHDVTFALEPGSFHFLTGASGAGKSSLLRLMYMGWKPTRGLVSLFGHDLSTLERPQFPALRRQIGVVFQEFRLLEHLTVFENVALPLRLQRQKPADITRHVTELLDWVGIGDRAHSMPRTLSGGQQQRVAIARAVIGRPALLLADEPTGNVDEEIGEKILYLFEELNKLGTTVVIATHNERNVRRLAYPRLHLNEGILDMLPAAEGGMP